MQTGADRRFFGKIAKNYRHVRKLGVQPAHLVSAAVLSITAAFMEGLSVAILFLFARGIIARDFTFVAKSAVFKELFSVFPSLQPRSNEAVFITLLLLLVVTMISKNAFTYTASVTVLAQARKAVNAIRKLIFHRYLNFGIMFYDENNIGYLHTKLVSYPSYIVMNIKIINTALAQFFTLTIYFVFMFFISWKLTAIIILIIPILNYALKGLIIKIRNTSQRFTLACRDLSNNISNILTCAPLVKLYKTERKEESRFSGLSDRLASIELSIDKTQNLIAPIQESIVLLMVLLLVLIMSLMVAANRHEDIAKYIIYLYALKKAQNSFGFLNEIRSSVGSVRGPISEIGELFSDKDKHHVGHGEDKFAGLKERIEYRHLNYSYLEGKPVIKDVSFTIEKGRITAIVGPTGSGKTTLVSLLLRFYDCPPSSIFIDGKDIGDFDLKSLMAGFAYVSQDTLLLNDTIRNNIAYGLDAVSEQKLIKVAKEARLYDFIASLPRGFDSTIGDRGVKLSGGEIQRLSIARALLKESEILIFDEATSSLDATTEKLIQDAVGDAVIDRTTIIIAHRLSSIKRADKIVMIEHGRLVEEGTLEALLAMKGKFFQYWQGQRFY